MIHPRLAGFAGIALVLTVSALAETSVTARPAAAAPPAPHAGTLAGTVQKAEGRWRSNTIVGAVVRGDGAQGIATVRDLLIDGNGQVETAILSVTGTRTKFVAVPFSQLKFVPARGAPIPRAPGAGVAVLSSQSMPVYRIMLPGETRQSLRAKDAFRFG